MTDFMQSIGIDVSKKKLDVCFLANNKYKYKRFTNDFDGIDKLIEVLNGSKAPIIIESTGDYHLLLSCMLKEANLNPYIINPIITNKQIRATIRGSKSDKKDARLLAEIGVNQIGELTPFRIGRNTILLKKENKSIRKVRILLKSLIKSLKQFKETESLLSANASVYMTELRERIDEVNYHGLKSVAC